MSLQPLFGNASMYLADDCQLIADICMRRFRSTDRAMCAVRGQITPSAIGVSQRLDHACWTHYLLNCDNVTVSKNSNGCWRHTCSGTTALSSDSSMKTNGCILDICPIALFATREKNHSIWLSTSQIDFLMGSIVVTPQVLLNTAISKRRVLNPAYVSRMAISVNSQRLCRLQPTRRQR